MPQLECEPRSVLFRSYTDYSCHTPSTIPELVSLDTWEGEEDVYDLGAGRERTGLVEIDTNHAKAVYSEQGSPLPSLEFGRHSQARRGVGSSIVETGKALGEP